jgi:hypothetical protein
VSERLGSADAQVRADFLAGSEALSRYGQSAPVVETDEESSLSNVVGLLERQTGLARGLRPVLRGTDTGTLSKNRA